MQDNLPELEKRPKSRVMPLVQNAFGVEHVARLDDDGQGKFRVLLKRSVCQLAEGTNEPSKSQWGTLKKRLKRRDHRVFIFKQHGLLEEGEGSNSRTYYYLDFGFFRYDER